MYRGGNKITDVLAKFVADQAKENTCFSTPTPIRMACNHPMLGYIRLCSKVWGGGLPSFLTEIVNRDKGNCTSTWFRNK